MEQLLFAGVCIGGAAFMVGYALVHIIKWQRLDTTKKKGKNSDDADPSAESQYNTVTVKATVVDQACCVKMVGYKTPKTVKEFAVAFQTETGDILRFSVPEEMYDGFEQGQVGILSVVDGEVYGFELAEADSII